MNWEFVPAREFGRYAPQWDALNHDLYDGHPLFDSRFVSPLIKHFATPKDLLVMRRRDRVIDAMTLVRQGKLGVWQSFLPSQAQIAPSLLPDASALTDLVKALPLPTLRLDLLAQDPTFSPSLIGNTRIETTPHAQTMTIAVDQTFETYWGSRSKNLRKNVSKWKNRLAEDGHDFTLAHHKSAEALQKALERYSAIESRGWKGAAGTAINLQQPQGRFYSEIVESFSKTDAARITELVVAGTVVASRIIICSRAMAIVLKTTYDENWSRYAPGRLLLYLLLEDFFRTRMRERVEFYTNATQEQLAWATGERQIYHTSIFRNAFSKGLFRIYHNCHRKKRAG